MRLIDADKLLDELKWFESSVSEYKKEEVRSYIRRVEAAPTVDAVPVVHGRWVIKHRHRGGFKQHTGRDAMGEVHTIMVDERFEIDDPYCSECGKLNESEYLNFCPNYGAKMDGGVEDG